MKQLAEGLEPGTGAFKWNHAGRYYLPWPGGKWHRDLGWGGAGWGKVRLLRSGSTGRSAHGAALWGWRRSLCWCDVGWYWRHTSTSSNGGLAATAWGWGWGAQP